MRKLIVVSLLLSYSCLYSQNSALFPILDKGLCGYMNSKGEVMVKPQFERADKFSEGLAVVRKGGYYGYINTSGKIAIEANLDFAFSFDGNYALVTKDGIPQVIQKNGKPLFANTHPELVRVNDNRFIVTTIGKHKGVIDASGKRIIDTIFTEITPTDNNMYIVRGSIGKVTNYSDDVGIINDKGKFVVPYGIYRYIWPYKEGLARIERQTPYQTDDYIGFVDLNGKLVIKIDDKKIYKVDDFNGPFSKASLVSSTDYNKAEYYEGFLDKKGNLAVDTRQYKIVYPFTGNRAFAYAKESGYYLIDRTGRRINKDSYFNVREEGFADGKAVVANGGISQIIDTNANVLMAREFYFDKSNYINNVLFYFYSGTRKWSFWDIENNLAPEIKFDDFDPAGFQNGLLLIRRNNQLIYIDKTGRKIWEQQSYTSDQPVALNIDYMNRGYYHAYSTPLLLESKFGGWAESNNLPYKNAKFNWSQKEKLNLYLSAEDTLFGKNILAKKLFLLNETLDTIFFPAQDSRLNLTIQAMDSKGNWRDIEYLPNSWCGNSYHSLHLATGEYWKFATPVYEGGIKTKLRASIQCYTKKPGDTERQYAYIFSNEFEGSINPAQFWRKLEYYPTGLMDPYLD